MCVVGLGLGSGCHDSNKDGVWVHEMMFYHIPYPYVLPRPEAKDPKPPEQEALDEIVAEEQGHTSATHDLAVRAHQRPCRKDNDVWSSVEGKSDKTKFGEDFGRGSQKVCLSPEEGMPLGNVVYVL